MSLTTTPDNVAPAVEQRISRPIRYMVRMAVFLGLVGFGAFILQRPIMSAFMANPGLNGLIIGCLAVGIVVAWREMLRLRREAASGDALRAGAAANKARPLPLLAPLVPALPALRLRALTVSQSATVLESIALRLDEGRDTLRYLAGLLVFLGLLGTFWGLLETVSSIGGVINTLRAGGEAGVLFEELKAGLSAPLAGMGLSFSSSLFGVAGSLVLGFLDLQVGQAQRRFRMDIEGWLVSGLGNAQPEASPPAAVMAMGPGTAGAPELVQQLQRTAQVLSDNAGGGKQATQAMANLAEGIQGLVQHMRSEQQLIRDWVEAQSAREKETRRLLERLLAERTRTD
ncbi:MAG: flagellar motor protein MotA [Bosea sp.]|nr:flagellar motor protein MotA [Bosea sp. (in: a-proteobacteria)]